MTTYGYSIRNYQRLKKIDKTNENFMVTQLKITNKKKKLPNIYR